MLDSAKYVNSNGDTITFGMNGVYLTSALPLRSYKWDYSSNYGQITGFYKEAQEKSFSIVINANTRAEAYSIRNKLFEIFEYDVLTETAGKLYIGDYYLECYVVENTKNHRDYKDSALVVDITVVSETVDWINPDNFLHQGALDEEPKKYPYQYSYYYDEAVTTTVTAVVGADFILVIYGEAENPSITISGNTYKVNVTVAEGQMLEINSYNKTIYLIDEDGTKTSVFWNADRSSYIFEKIPNGEVLVEYDGEYAYDLTIMNRRSEPLWQ